MMIKIEQIIAGLLLKFNELDSNDLMLMINELNKNYKVDMDKIDIYFLKDYIEVNNGIVTLKERISLDTFINKYGVKLKNKLKFLQGDVVKNYLYNMSEEEFLIRKVDFLKYIPLKDTSKLLRNNQLRILPKMFSDGYLMSVCNDRIGEDNSHVIELTQKGKGQLFFIDHMKDIEEFKNDLINLNYDYTLLFIYLMSHNFDDDKSKILNAEKFYNYCLDFGIYPYMVKSKEKKLYSN